MSAQSPSSAGIRVQSGSARPDGGRSTSAPSEWRKNGLSSAASSPAATTSPAETAPRPVGLTASAPRRRAVAAAGRIPASARARIAKKNGIP